MNSYELKLRKSFLELASEHKHFFEPHSQKLNVKDRHDLRVLIRRMDATLKLMKDYIPKVHYQKVRKILNNVLDRVGEYRNIDVLHDDEKEFQLDLNLDFHKKVPLKKFISKKEFKTLENELIWIEKRMEEMTEIPLKDRTLALKRKLNEWKRHKLFSNKDLHQFRIFMKRVRYSLEAFSLPVSRMKSLQDHLGRFHDLEVLQTYTVNPLIMGEMKAEHKFVLERKDPAINRALGQLEGLFLAL
jgi:CHAD domain-containing protein